MVYDFKWNSIKAKRNIVKHGVSFELAATVFRDTRAISIYDDAPSESQDRWVTFGIAESGSILAVHHTIDENDVETVLIGIISSRKATRREIVQYKEA